MATFVFSDVHGHRATLDRLLEKVSPSSEDEIFMLGDMIDRGPDPVGVLRLCRSLPNCTVLMGNHEDLMLASLGETGDAFFRTSWEMNGGAVTAQGLERLPEHERIDLVDWVGNLPTHAFAFVGGRPYIMVHAGILPDAVPELLVKAVNDISAEAAPEDGPAAMGWNIPRLETLLAMQDPEDLMWVREDFWGHPTGLLNKRGEGPIVIAGHTPTAYLVNMADRPDRLPFDRHGLCRMVRVGACAETCGVADRWDIDCGAAGGAGFGNVMMLRLEGAVEIYEPVREGE